MAMNAQSLAAATALIGKSERLLVIPHANVDPDGISSALACERVWSAIGKQVTVICPDAKPESLKFLPGFEQLVHDLPDAEQFVITINLDPGTDVDTLRYTVEGQQMHITVVPKHGKIRSGNIVLGGGDKPYDLVVIVDTADLALLGPLYTEHVDLFSSIPMLNVDHHISNTNYGQMQLIDPTSSSCTELLYQWFSSVPEWKEHLTPDVATLLLTGLITDTRSFQNPNTTPRSLEIAAELLERGGRQQDIVKNIYKTKPLSTLKIWGRALNRTQVDRAAGIVWSSVSLEDLQELGADSRETHGLLDELLSTIPHADVYVLFTETENGVIKASVRSSAAVDSSKMTGELFQGGGHARASGFRVPVGESMQLTVLECIQKMKAYLQQHRGAPTSGAVGTPTIVPEVITPAPQSGPGIDVAMELGSATEPKGDR